MKVKNEAGKIYGNLTVTERATSSPRGKAAWRCICACGNFVIVPGDNLRFGHTKSCGCLRQTVNAASKTHGECQTRLYHIWASMKSRCDNPKNKSFKYYGGKGILVCSAWHEFVAFSNWAKASGYNEKLEIDRKDGSKNYSPENCRWATKSQQALNRASRKRLSTSYKGIYKSSGSRWLACIRVEGKHVSLGCYDSEEMAARAFDAAAQKYHGEFVTLNFPR